MERCHPDHVGHFQIGLCNLSHVSDSPSCDGNSCVSIPEILIILVFLGTWVASVIQPGNGSNHYYVIVDLTSYPSLITSPGL